MDGLPLIKKIYQLTVSCNNGTKYVMVYAYGNVRNYYEIQSLKSIYKIIDYHAAVKLRFDCKDDHVFLILKSLFFIHDWHNLDCTIHLKL